MLNLRAPLGILLLAFIIYHSSFPIASAQQSRPTPGQPSAATDIGLAKRVLAARHEYQLALEQLHAYYGSVGDSERERWAEDELKQFHRVPKAAYIMDLDVAGPGLRPDQNVPAANELYRKAMSYKGKGFGSDYTDNQIRAELLLQQLLGQYPTSNKCSDAAYQLGDIYENRRPAQYRRAAVYYERCVQWNPTTQYDARLRAAKLYDRQMRERAKAIELYKAVLNNETDERRRQEAQRRLGELSATP
jgi:TolA-binding protein